MLQNGLIDLRGPRYGFNEQVSVAYELTFAAMWSKVVEQKSLRCDELLQTPSSTKPLCTGKLPGSRCMYCVVY